MQKKNKDPFPITDVYHVTSTLVDAATVVVTDLCENLSNSIDTHCDDIIENLKKISMDQKKNQLNIQKKTLESEDFYFLVKKRIERTNKIINGSNQ